MDSFYILCVATAGNTIGSAINYFIGKYAYIWAKRKKYMTTKKIDKGKKYFDKYGVYALLLAWIPLAGDSLTFVAGVLRYSFWKFLILVFIAKLSRFLFIIYLYELLANQTNFF